MVAEYSGSYCGKGMSRTRWPEKAPACLDATKERPQLQEEDSVEDERSQEKNRGEGREEVTEGPTEELLAPTGWEPTGKYRKCELVGRDRKNPMY